MTATSPSAKRAHRLRIKRAYEPVAENDGFRVLVDRLWPRGVAKNKAHIDLWLKDVSPSDALRRKFHSHPDKWNAFVAAYERELAQDPAKTAAAELRDRLRHGPLTLLYAARDEVHNNAIVLKSWLERTD
jgi:uncharacterized protein YeaO (DUF488 family)